MNSYVCVLSTDSYIKGLLVLNENLKKMKSNYSLFCLVTNSVSKEIEEIIINNNIKYKRVDNIDGFYVDKHNPQWTHSFSKINIFNLTEFNKIVYLDLDLLITQNIDELFKYHHISMVSDQPFSSDYNSGVMVVQPNNKDYLSMIDLLKKNHDKYKGDQDLINEYFKGKIKEIPHKYNSVRAVFYEKNDKLKHNVCIIDNTKKPKIIHYIGVLKPFMLDEEYDDHYCDLYFSYLKKYRRVDSNMNNEYNILVSFDDNYADLALSMLYSIREHNDAKLRVFIYYLSLTNDSIKKVKSFFKKYDIGELYLNKFDINEMDLPISLDHTSVETYIRLFVPFIIDSNIDKLLYLDCDIVCNGNIEEFYNTDLNGYYAAGVENIPPLNTDDFNDVINKILKLGKDNKYINAGVLLINTNKIKEDFSIEEVYNSIEKNKDILVMQDQDIINILFHKKIKIMPRDYNYQINCFNDNDLDNKAKLIHYSDSSKPWNINYTSEIKAKYYYDVLKKIGKTEEVKKLKRIHSLDKIDIIIPVYNSSKTLERALDSIVNLDNKDDIKVYIIDDCSTEKYSGILFKYKYVLNIVYKKLDENKGPGYARNYGINISYGKYIVFLDSDDCFSSSNSVSLLYNSITRSNVDVVRSTFERINQDRKIIFKEDNFGLHGKIYRRSFISDNNIYLKETRSFEDTYFNTLIYLNGGKIKDIDSLTYYWHDSNNSLSYSENDGDKLYDYAKNMYDALTYGQYYNKERLSYVIIDSLYFIYSYLKNCNINPNSISKYIEGIINVAGTNNININNLILNYYNDDYDEIAKFISNYNNSIEKNNNVINEYNLSNSEYNNKILKNSLAEFGDNNLIELPINTNCGGENLHIGSGVYINYGLSLVDNGNIYIGDNVFIGPNVNIMTLNHGITLKERQEGVIEIKDVIIEDNVWIGGAVTILPGVKIGENSVIGAGSVVTKNIPKNSLAFGNPCKVQKKINN